MGNIATQTFSFTLFRFTGPKGNRITENVHDFSIADGMRALVENSDKSIESCRVRVQAWADTHNLAIIPLEPYPSARYPGKAGLEFRFGSDPPPREHALVVNDIGRSCISNRPCAMSTCLHNCPQMNIFIHEQISDSHP